jgi:hypothetical protein
MPNSLFKKQHERNARLPEGELERRREEAQRVRERHSKSDQFAPPHAHDSASQGGGGLAQLGAIWFSAGLFEKLAY